MIVTNQFKLLFSTWFLHHDRFESCAGSLIMTAERITRENGRRQIRFDTLPRVANFHVLAPLKHKVQGYSHRAIHDMS